MTQQSHCWAYTPRKSKLKASIPFSIVTASIHIPTNSVGGLPEGIVEYSLIPLDFVKQNTFPFRCVMTFAV